MLVIPLVNLCSYGGRIFESAKPRFIPIQFLVRQCVSMNISYEDQTLLLLCPVKNLI